MYKSKLQELCHQRSWSLPEYATVKEGPDHLPRFTGTVYVNGVPFQTPDSCRSSKQAQNEAARLAYDHLSTPQTPSGEPPGAAPPPPSGSTCNPRENAMSHHSVLLANLEKEQPGLLESNEILRAAKSSSIANDNTVVKDMQHLCKSQLQTFAQKRSLAMPAYWFEHEGPPHIARFRCKVSIGGRTYETVEFYKTLKEAESAAATIALISLSSDTYQEVDCGLCKSLLQDFTLKLGHNLPVYNTVGYGESHIPTFVSTVVVEGESFTGQEARTKKMAESSAAKVAYRILKERSSGNKRASSSSQFPVLQREKAALSSYSSPADCSIGFQQKVTSGPTPNVISHYSGSKGKQINDDENVEASNCRKQQRQIHRTCKRRHHHRHHLQLP